MTRATLFTNFVARKYRLGQRKYQSFISRAVASVTSLCLLVSMVAAAGSSALAVPAYANQLVSQGMGGQPANNQSDSATITPDGRYVVFTSSATNLTSQNLPGSQQIFITDRATNTTTLASAKPNGELPRNVNNGVLSANGRYLAFGGNFQGDYTSGQSNIYLKDLQTGSVKLLTHHYTINAPPFDDLTSGPSSISDDGRYVVFETRSGQYIPDTSDRLDKVIVCDTVNDQLILVSANAAGEPGNLNNWAGSISGDGRYVLFGSNSTNLVPDRDPAASIFPTRRDVYLKDLQTGDIRIVSTNANGAYGDDNSDAGILSHDGKHVVFSSRANNMGFPRISYFANAYEKDLTTGQLTLISAGRDVPANGYLSGVGGLFSISGDGSYVTFMDLHDNSTASQFDPYIWSAATGQLTRFGLSYDGSPVQPRAFYTLNRAVSDDGQAVFSSSAPNMVPNDTNGFVDVFIYGHPADITPPAVTGTVTPAPNAAGWNNSDVTVDWNAVDDSGSATIPASTHVTTEGYGQTITSASSCDPTNNCATGTVSVNIDKTVPTLATPQWSAKPQTHKQYHDTYRSRR